MGQCAVSMNNLGEHSLDAVWRLVSAVPSRWRLLQTLPEVATRSDPLQYPEQGVRRVTQFEI
jgi:hypothetical protein